MNKVAIIGNLTADPELRATQSGKQVASFTVAWNDPHVKDKSQAGHYFNVTAWEKLAEVVSKYCKKGNKIAVTGHLVQQRWQDKDGNKRSQVCISAEAVDFLSAPKSDDQSQIPNVPERTDNNVEQDDIPF